MSTREVIEKLHLIEDCVSEYFDEVWNEQYEDWVDIHETFNEAVERLEEYERELEHAED